MKLEELSRVRKIIIGIGSLLIVLLISGQAYFVVTHHLEPWFFKILAYRDLDARERAAVFNLGETGSDYVRFVNSLTDEEDQILLPAKRHDARFVFTNKDFVQYFFLPNVVHECNSPDLPPCSSRIEQDGFVVLAMGDFPPEEYVPRGKQFVEFLRAGALRGAYVNKSPSSLTLEPGKLLGAGRINEVTGAAILLLAFSTLGAILSLLVMKQPRLSEVAAAALPLGMGSSTFSAFFLSVLGMEITRFSLTVLVSALIASLLVLLLTRPRFRPSALLQEIRIAKATINFGWFAGATAVMVWLLAYAAIAVGMSYTYTDPIHSWVLKGYAISEFGEALAAEEFGALGLAYPLNLPLAITFFRSLVGDLGPTAKVIPSALLGSLIIGMDRFWSWQRVPRRYRLMGVLALLSLPVVASNVTRAVANLPGAVYLGLGSLFAVIGLHEHDRGRLLLGGGLLGLAAWTRFEAFHFALIIGSLLFVIRHLEKKRTMIIGWLVAPLLLIAVPWQLISFQFSADNYTQQAPQAFLRAVFAGEFTLQPLFTIGRLFIEDFLTFEFPRDTWTAFSAILFLLVLIGTAARSGINSIKGIKYLWASTVSVLVGPIAIFYMWSYSRPDIERIVSSGLSRALLPAAVLLIAVAVAHTAMGVNEVSDNEGL